MEFMFTDTELQLNTERNDKYQGTAKIDLDHISFHPNFSRPIEQKNIDRLCEIFRQEGCCRFEVQNHITAIVSRESLQAALRAARKTPEELLATDPNKFSHLRFSTGQVLCLHGQHRIRAGAEVLPESDRWWTVDIYLDDISPTLRTSLVEEYTNERQPSDGEIYRKISQYQREDNAHFQKRWWARLSDTKAKRLRALHKNIELSTAFNALLPIPGVWGGMSIGNLPKVMALKCDEEVVHYLTLHVKKFWISLVSADAVTPDRAAMMKIDAHTVGKLELMAPGLSRQDARAVKGWVLSGEVLGAFTETERIHMSEKLERFDGIIPSLHTFFKDVDYLGRCANAVKRLFALSMYYPTVRTAMRHHREPTDSEGCLIQTSESRFERRPGSRADHLELAYRQVWLYAMRHYPQLARETKNDDLLAKPENEKADGAVVYKMAILAQKLGFKSTAIDEIINGSPDWQIARDCLLKARKPDCYEFTTDDFETSIRGIVEFFSKARLRANPLPPDPLVHLPADQKGRCGLPSKRAQKQDRRFLFVNHLHQPTVAPTEKLSTMAIRRCVYFAFFGRPDSRSPNPTSDPISRGPAPSNTPMLPLVFSDHEPLGESSPDFDMPLDHEPEDTPQTEAEQRAAEQSQQQEAEQRAAAEAADRERLQRDAEAAEQENSRREAEERAAPAEQQRLQQEAAERAVVAEQERMHQEAMAAENSSLQSEVVPAVEPGVPSLDEDERIARERATALAQLEPEGADVPVPPETQPPETSQPDGPLDLPGWIALLRKRSSLGGNESITSDNELPAPASRDDLPPTVNETPPATPTRGVSILEPIPEESSSVFENDRRRQEDQRKVANASRAAEETEDEFTQTRSMAHQDLFSNESDEERAPATVSIASSERQGGPGLPQQDPSDVVDQEASQHAGLTRPAGPPIPPARRKSRPAGIRQDRKSAIAARNTANRRGATGDVSLPAARRRTQFDLVTNLSSRPDHSGNDSSSAAAETSTTATGLSRLWRRRKNQRADPAGPSSLQRLGPVPARPEPNRPSDRDPDTIIFWVRRGGEWREIQRVVIDPSDLFGVARVANRYKWDHNATFHDKAMRNITAAQCLRAAQDDGSNSIFMTFNDGTVDRAVTQAMVTGAEAVTDAGNPDVSRKRKRTP